MNALIELAWPMVALATLGVASLFLRVAMTRTLTDERAWESLRREGLAAHDRNKADLEAIRKEAADLAHRLEKLERLNQGVPPKGERHTPEHLARFR